MSDEEGESSIDKWTVELRGNPASVPALQSRGATYMQLGQPVNAERDARAWLALQPKSARAFGLLGEALLRQSRNDEAVKAYKQGVALDANDVALQDGLHRARVAVLDELVADESVPAFVPMVVPVTMVGAQPPATVVPLHTSSTSATAVSPSDHSTFTHRQNAAQVVTTSHNDLPSTMSPADLMATLLLEIFNNLHMSSPQLSYSAILVALGVVTWCLQRIRTLSVVAAVALLLTALRPCRHYLLHICTRPFKWWLAKSSDKLYHMTLLPCVLATLPMLLRLIGLLNLFAFIHQDQWLACGVTLYLATTLFVTQDHPKLVKAGLHIVLVLYWVVHLGHVHDIFRFVPPIAFELAGYLLGSIPPRAIQDAIKAALASQLKGVASSQLHLWGVVALGHWAIDFWNQPSTLSVDDILTTFQSLQGSAVQLFQAEIRAHRRRQRQVGGSFVDLDDEYAVLVAYVAKTVRNLPPSWPVATVVMLVQRCVHMVACAMLFMLFGGTFGFALIPLMVLEVNAFSQICQVVWEEGRTTEHPSRDSLDVICMTSPPVLAVWSNLKAGVVGLECSVVASKVATATTSAALLASRLGHVLNVPWEEDRIVLYLCGSLKLLAWSCG
ncbi:hypothetical protein, variant [Aphanomyces astaci]|uniref:Uncharacterized protein n=1 Tax=Aphanomyces astaci TaxID=112090 RepID=W4G6R8_APHAT|nr:hypothetical protein, variant [Aphanomyces astaci]ETV75402.1 hypothetical protein, variant [Aphanomyces astaci]|eukprot:XP_009835036.1 hypothetical protein, variant [Aphanomyces astaci]